MARGLPATNAVRPASTAVSASVGTDDPSPCSGGGRTATPMRLTAIGPSRSTGSRPAGRSWRPRLPGSR